MNWDIKFHKLDLTITNKYSHEFVHIYLVERFYSNLAEKGLLRIDKLNNKWYELKGLPEADILKKISKDMESLWKNIEPIAKRIAHHGDFVWMCSCEDSDFYLNFFGDLDNWNIKIIRGSKIKDIIRDNDLPFYYDPQILMLSFVK